MKNMLAAALFFSVEIGFGQSRNVGIYRAAELLFGPVFPVEKTAVSIRTTFQLPVNFELKIKPSIMKNGFFSLPVYCENDLALFCRMEAKMERILHTPVRFRLGSASYVDWLEGKNSARFMDFAR